MTELKQIEEFVWEIPKQGKMTVPGRFYGNKQIMEQLVEEESRPEAWSALRQIKNVAMLPGVEKYSLALADVHPGYGAPIGGVIASDLQEGVITFGAVGFDINCGVRTLATPFTKQEVKKKKEELADALFKHIPAGLGSTGKLRLNEAELDEVIVNGAEYVVKQGYGLKEDLQFTEEGGKIKGAGPEHVSQKAKKRAFKQIGTLGSGNHYAEVQFVEEIFDEEAAKTYGLEKEQTLISIHCGSRALGHQIGTDYLGKLDSARKKYGIEIAERELVCAPIESEEGQEFFSAVKAGINTAFANRQVIAHLARQAFAEVFGVGEKEIKQVYDIGHNTAKIEKHKILGKGKNVLVQRKGSTRGFGPGREEVPEKYRSIGQPVIVGGTMGTSSYLLKGTEKGMDETFGSTIHGAGRSMSRTAATKKWKGEEVVRKLKEKGIIIKARSIKGIAEEAPDAYKDVVDVVEVMHKAGITEKVVGLKPVVCIKG